MVFVTSDLNVIEKREDEINMEILINIFAKTVPGILIVLGWLTVIGNEFSSWITSGASDPTLGYLLMFIGIMIYVVELFAFR